jgi:hypothetical protein
MKRRITPTSVLRTRRILVCGAILAGGALFAMPNAAFAGNADGARAVFTVNGQSYVDYSTILTSSGSEYANTATGPSSGTVATGYLGSRGRLFNDAGTMQCQSAIAYNTQSLVAGQYWNGQCANSLHGNFYSYGVSFGWNGSGYNASYNFRTVSQPAVVGKAEAASGFAINRKGKTFGSAMHATSFATEPDFISVTTNSGKLGYVAKQDLAKLASPAFTSTRAALAWQTANEGKTFSIPSYASDGTTIIGSFDTTVTLGYLTTDK